MLSHPLTNTSARANRRAASKVSEWQVLREALGNIAIIKYPAGVELFRQGSFAAQIYFLESGLIKLTRCEDNGVEFILDLGFAGAVVGCEAALRRIPQPFSAITVTECHLSQLLSHDFLDLMTTTPRFNFLIQNHLCLEVLNHAERMSEIACLPARPRLEHLLWTIAEANGGEKTPEFRLQLPIRQWEVAQLLAITPTYLCRLLVELEQDGLISRRNGWIILRTPNRLRHRSESESTVFTDQLGSIRD